MTGSDSSHQILVEEQKNVSSLLPALTGKVSIFYWLILIFCHSFNHFWNYYRSFFFEMLQLFSRCVFIMLWLCPGHTVQLLQILYPWLAQSFQINCQINATGIYNERKTFLLPLPTMLPKSLHHISLGSVGILSKYFVWQYLEYHSIVFSI